MCGEQKKNVLVVDDDDLLRDFYARVLESHGYSVISATNGDEAISILESPSESIVLIIADLLMPIRTGWELIEYIKNSEALKNLPVIAITGLAGSREEFEKIEASCDAVLHKGDFDLESFMNVINTLVEKKS